eukprot:TRINITY_DN14794_c1_g1_i3.p1 TRINITY_DN14794_c1_g1~~TRINITY_DN14794_c1_g1_i3.p1  ORF type:complete len:356 (-),score=82.18 TRINITY_DN14794_c1_g1_i3:84-1151(-)
MSDCKNEADWVSSSLMLLELGESSQSLFKVNQQHVKKDVPMPLSASEIKKYSFADLLSIHEETTYSDETLSMWGRRSSKATIRHRLAHYTDYLNNTQRSSEAVRSMISCIVHELKSSPEKCDVAGILLALGMHASMCDVQKEIGIRTVFAAMTDSMMHHMKANALDSKVLMLLKRDRSIVTEMVVRDVLIDRKLYDLSNVDRFINSHHIMPIQNQLSPFIGVDHVPEPNPMPLDCKTEDLLDSFWKKYDVEHIVKLIDAAMNDSHRLLNYQDCVDYFESIKPAEVADVHAFLSEFVFNMDSGKFNKKAIKLMLWKMDILELTEEGINAVQSLEAKRSVISVDEHSLENEFWLMLH